MAMSKDQLPVNVKEMSKEKLTLEEVRESIQYFLAEDDKKSFQIRQDKLAGEIRAIGISHPDEKATKLLTKRSFKLKGLNPQGSPELNNINSANRYFKLKDCNYLHMLIPATEDIRQREALYDDVGGLLPEEERNYVNEEINIQLFRKMQEKLMSDLVTKLDDPLLESEFVTVRTSEQVKEELEKFVETNHQYYKKLFISFVGHGGERGSIVTHDVGTEFTNDHFHAHLRKLSEKIPIQALMGNCYSHMYDESSLAMNLIVYGTTSQYKATATYTFTPEVEGKVKIDGYDYNIVIGVEDVEHDGFTEYCESIDCLRNKAGGGSKDKGSPTQDVNDTEAEGMDIS